MFIKFIILLLHVILSVCKSCSDIFTGLGLEVKQLNIDESHQCHENENKEAISLELLDVDLSKGDINVIFEAPSLKKLKLISSNIIIPNKFDKLPNLVEIFISNINYEKFPDSVFKLGNLKELTLNNCGFTTIPDKFDKISNLTTFRLSGNKFEFLPDSIYELKNLTTIELNSNPNYKGIAYKNPVIASINEGRPLELDDSKNGTDDESKNEENPISESGNPSTDSNYKYIDALAYNLKKAIDDYNVISFDIFDTLLVRPYVRPIDLFFHLEYLYNVTGFTEQRMKAERDVRKKMSSIKDEITFDEIYEQIDSQYKWLKEKELSLEYDVLNTRTFMKDIYNYACQKNKKIIIISDMYLSKEFLKDVLKKNGYTKFDNVYISSEYGKTKGTGELYNIALEELNISVKDILHIGDNQYSDINRPRKLGINAFFIPKVFDFLLKTDSRIEFFYKNHKDDLGASIMLGLLAYQSEQSCKNYWYEFGYKYAGPIILGYMQWLDQQLVKEKIDTVLFVARDGYTLEKVFNLISNSEAHTEYIYLPRKIAHECLSEESEIAEKSKKEYRLYLDQFNLQDKKLAMIDSMTYWYSSQRTLVELLPDKDIIGYYWLVGPHPIENLTFETFQKDHIHRLGELIELIMTAPTSPIETIANGKPVFKEPDEPESVRIKIYPDLSSGAVDFAKDYVNNFKKLKGFFSCEMLMEWIKLFQSRPTEIDKISFFNIEHASDENHEGYYKLMRYWY